VYGAGWVHIENEDTKTAIDALKNGDKALSETGEELSESDKNVLLAKMEASIQSSTRGEPAVVARAPRGPRRVLRGEA
jgi:phosphosulfolactate synthase (CoM biosynthesis protein A)